MSPRGFFVQRKGAILYRTGDSSAVTNAGTEGQVLTSHAGSRPTFEDPVNGDIYSAGYWSPLTNGDPVTPELIFAGGDAIMVWVPTP